MLLAIDAGNTFVKWAYHDGTKWQATARVALAEFAKEAAQLAARPRPDTIVISSVAGDLFRQPMTGLLEQWRAEALWVTPQSRAYGVENGYGMPTQLGSDRWASLIATRRITQESAVVASIGTAVTVDVLGADGLFRGGLILPGLELMQRSLWQGTAGIPKAVGTYERFPTSTANAVYTGVLLATAGAVERMVEAAGSGTEVILTGGGAAALAPFIRPSPRLMENLVLEGLLCIAREEGMV